MNIDIKKLLEYENAAPKVSKRKHHWTEQSRISYRKTYNRNRKLRELGITPPDHYQPAKTKTNPNGSPSKKRKYVISGKYATQGRFEKARLKREAEKLRPKRPRGRPRKKSTLFESFAKEIELFGKEIPPLDDFALDDFEV
tara:strand:- start:580 stop:1002 length:423 start_codon:yes stop_codon:yes gene_type:complete